jgi:type I restriction enzyme M protein
MLAMFEQTFKNIDDILWKDSGCSTELDYAEQSSWILFLKWLDDYEKDKETKAKLENKKFKPTLDKEYQWSTWAIVKDKAGKIDFNKTLTGPDLKKFVDDKLFPYLSSFRNSAESFDTLEYKIGEIFSELKNKLQDGYTLRDVVNEVDNLQFQSNEQKHELSALYEEKIKNMGNAGRNGGEYYTPRPLIKSIIKVIDPKVGETVYDGAVGSAGFLVEAFEHMSHSKSLTTSELKSLQTKSFYGAEKKTLAYIIGIMNMILHGIESPNIIHQNTLETNIQEIQNKDRVDVILANPPFGGKEKANIQENFPIKTGETAYLFLQHFIKKLKVGGRCGVVIKNTFLSNTDNASIALRKQLLEECNLFAVLDLPGGAFLGTGVKTVVLFFEKGKTTKKLWYYQLNPGRNMGKTNSLNENDLENFIKLSKTQKLSDNSWSIDIDKINKDTLSLNAHNPNVTEEIDERTPEEIISEIEQLDKETNRILNSIKNLLK